MRLLFLSSTMGVGFGVSVVIDELARRLSAQGIGVDIGCLTVDEHYRGFPDLFLLDPNPDALRDHIHARHITHVIAHTSPYFEQLPGVKGHVQRWVWEHGDPPPDLFPVDGAQRRHIIEHKRRHIYAAVDKVITISHFVREDIGWPLADVIYNGADHVTEREPDCSPRNGPLRVGALMRLGAGERFYKGGDMFIRLAEAMGRHNAISFFVMGRGTGADAAEFRKAGIEVRLNATDEERSEYLRSLDVFFSPSLWEGFNLPLVEAQMSGTLAVAFDVGAHPEVTPFLVSDLAELESLLLALGGDREMLYRYSRLAQEHCKRKFSWQRTVSDLNRLLAPGIV